jgi:glutathione S-transferase
MPTGGKMLTLFYTPGACSMVPHIALEETGGRFDRVPVDFGKGEQLRPDYLSINPKGRVPALLTERGVVTEIPAILGFIARTFPDAGLAPWDDPFAFADMQAFHMYIATTIHVLFRQISRPEVYADGPAATAALKAKVPEMSNRYFTLIEQNLADGRKFVHGDAYSLSDPYLFVFASYLRMGDRGDLALFPNIRAHRARVRARPAVERTLAAEGLADHW